MENAQVLLSSTRIIESARQEARRATGQDTGMQGSSGQALGVAFGLLARREHGGAASIQAQFRELAQCLQAIGRDAPVDGAVRGPLASVLARIDAAGSGGNIHALESAWHEVLGEVEAIVSATAVPEANGAIGRLAARLVSWEAADLSGQLEVQDTGEADAGEIGAGQLQAYLRDRFDDPGLTVRGFRSLAGGFGKQTYLFDVAGAALEGGFVLRRDLRDPVFDNDCHLIHKEYEVIRAVHARGFPAPDALWLDREHRLLPGGDFIMMRRSPGKAGGSVFDADGGISADFSRLLAGIIARLHRLPPLPELAATTDSISAERWALPLDQCVRRYLSDWLALFQREPHLPSPAIVALFRWLIDHVPEVSGTPVLLHGDIGFHNLLLDDAGGLTAVLDWEFAHLGDPAEDLAYVRNTIGNALDWPTFMADYVEQGGTEVDERRLRFFQVWGHLRNAAAANLLSHKLHAGRVDDLKLAVLPHLYIPQFLRAAQALVDAHE